MKWIAYFLLITPLSINAADYSQPDDRVGRISDTINKVAQQVEEREKQRNEEIEKQRILIDAQEEQYKKERSLARAVLAKKPRPRIGMSEKQVLHGTNWGKPDYVNTTETAHGIFEQWVYADGQYLYFSNRRLTSIQY